MSGPSNDGADVRSEVASWLAANWDPDLSLSTWRDRLYASGWACPTWPVTWGGRGLPAEFAGVVAAEIERVGAVAPPDGVGTQLAAPTILEHGPDALRARLLAPTATGAVSWCQLFSEPGAGSDLAGLTTRADRDGDRWILNGQKVWTTSAHHADLGLLLARTDFNAPKHRGITCFVLPMSQPGVLVRPLRQMNGHASFNEVFLTDAVVATGDVVGDVNGGWAVALTTLAHERRLAPTRRPRPVTSTGGRARAEASLEAERLAEPYRWYPQRAGRVDLLVDRARLSARSDAPRVRQGVAAVIARARAAQVTVQRAAAARQSGRPGPEGSLAKLAGSGIARTAARAHGEIAGLASQLVGDSAPDGGVVGEVILSVPAASIAGGTDEIQRTILAERVLGLPKEPDVGRTVPFREYRTNAPADRGPRDGTAR